MSTSNNQNGKPPMVNGRIVPHADVQKLEASGGNPLPASVKVSMEAKLNTDLSNIRVHTGPNAARMTTTMAAQAFTVGNHIVLAPSLANSGQGRHLLAHELSHVVQQTRGNPKK
jgi:hypothetical protein